MDVTLQLGLGACPSIGLAETQSGANGTFLFRQLTPGIYCISIDPSSQANAKLLGSAPWTHPAYGQGVSRITITLKETGETRLVNFGRQGPAAEPTNPPSPTTAPEATTATPQANGCIDRIGFLADVTITDGTRIGANKSFDKTWRLRNTGTCTWTTNYDLVFVSGNRLQEPSVKNMPRSVAPGQDIELSVGLKAPADTGLYQGYWMLRNEINNLFGLGSSANQPFRVQIIVGPLGTTSSGSWRSEYFATRDLKGTVGFVRNDTVIDFDWDDRSPGRPLANDNFSVRWSGQSQFETGTYRFSVRVDDGARLYVDDRLVIDAWRDGSSRELSADVSLARGTHKVRLEYYERSGNAQVQLAWSQVDATFPQWQGKYWDNREFRGLPALIRNDKDVNFDWDDGSPAVGLPADNFSARWTREVTFERGTYRFNIRADDGVRFWIGDERVIDQWRDSSSSQVYTVDRTLVGKQRLKIEYYERSGNARVRLWWDRIEITPTPTETEPGTATMEPSPSATLTPEPTATETPAPTATIPSPEVILNMAENACSATWSNDSGELACPGTAGEGQGAVYTVANPMTETGPNDGIGLITEPEQKPLGLIQGTYPAIQLQSGDRLLAQIGCLTGQPSCSVEVELRLLLGDQSISLGNWTETADGTFRSIELDLSDYAG